MLAPGPLMTRWVLKSGRAWFRLMVHTPLLKPGSVVGMSNTIVSSVVAVLAASIAARKVQWPVPSLQTVLLSGTLSPSPVLLTVYKTPTGGGGGARDSGGSFRLCSI